METALGMSATPVTEHTVPIRWDPIELYAEDVTEVVDDGWYDENLAEGDPNCGPPSGCPCNPGTGFAFNHTTYDWLTVADMEDLSLPQGYTITGVEIDLLGRYDHGTTGSVRFEIDFPIQEPRWAANLIRPHLR